MLPAGMLGSTRMAAAAGKERGWGKLSKHGNDLTYGQIAKYV